MIESKGYSFRSFCTRTSSLRRLLFFLTADALIICISLFLAFFVHFEFSMNIRYLSLLIELALAFVALKIALLAAFRVYSITWRYVGINDLVNIFLAMLIAELLLVVLSLPSSLLPDIGLTGVSKRVFFVDGIVSFGLIVALRAGKRIYMEVIREKAPLRRGKNTLIVGAGNAGEMMLRDIARHGYEDYQPVGFLDDDPAKRGMSIHGVKVLGKTSDIEAAVRKHGVQVVIIAIPSMNHKVLRGLYDGAKKAKVETIRIVPRIYDFSQPDINLKRLEEISIEDLVGRQTVSVDYQGIGAFIRGKTVLITGAGGSIGAEIVNQVCTFAPERVVLFDSDETELHNQGLKLARLYPNLWGRLDFITGDVRDEGRLREVFALYRPRIVFHAAAYKHVPMMESNPKEAAKVNIFGTFALAKTARAYGVETFVMISTDKAVRPTSVMGATKRMAEYICRAFNEIKEIAPFSSGHPSLADGGVAVQNTENTGEGDNAGGRAPVATKFVSVRFGNVLGSRGSVLPLFLDQLKYGGPLTVTHSEMKRYFMTIPEAVSLVLQASILGEGGEVFVLDMGQPVHIVDIAEELIRLHGLEPYKDIDIEFTGLRPGEKLFEEILTAEEGTDSSRHEKVFIARNSAKYSLADIDAILAEFSAVIADPTPVSNDAVKILLRKYVKHYEENKG